MEQYGTWDQALDFKCHSTRTRHFSDDDLQALKDIILGYLDETIGKDTALDILEDEV